MMEIKETLKTCSSQADQGAGDGHYRFVPMISPVEWTFHLLQKFAHIVERRPRLEITEVARPDLKWLARPGQRSISQSAAQRFVDDVPKRSAGGGATPT
jgi:hypothetical protein